jgi:hypothetical protein
MSQTASFSANLHLDDVYPSRQRPITFARVSGANRQDTNAMIEAKFQEHIRLFKEYIECCRAPEARFDLSLDDFAEPATARFDLSFEDQGTGMDMHDISSFLRSPCTVRPHAARNSPLAIAAFNAAGSCGPSCSRDGPASRRQFDLSPAATTTTTTTDLRKDLSAKMTDTSSFPSSSGSSPDAAAAAAFSTLCAPPPPAANDGHPPGPAGLPFAPAEMVAGETVVYRAQVALALASGRAVWL